MYLISYLHMKNHPNDLLLLQCKYPLVLSLPAGSGWMGIEKLFMWLHSECHNNEEKVGGNFDWKLVVCFHAAFCCLKLSIIQAMLRDNAITLIGIAAWDGMYECDSAKECVTSNQLLLLPLCYQHLKRGMFSISQIFYTNSSK